MSEGYIMSCTSNSSSHISSSPKPKMQLPKMATSADLPIILNPVVKPPVLITPHSPTPKQALYLTNLDDQYIFRYSTKYLYLFRKSTSAEKLKQSLSRVLVDYFPLAGRLRSKSPENDHKLEVECNGEGALFAEAFMDMTAEEFNEIAHKPNLEFEKLLMYYGDAAPSFLDIPPLVVQVTNLRCGGMILCAAVHHPLCDGGGTNQFFRAWAHLTRTPGSELPITPIHSRHILKPRDPPQVKFSHPTYTRPSSDPQNDPDMLEYLQSQPLVTSSITFRPSDILRLKSQCAPSLKCTSFEVLASHTWRCYIRSLPQFTDPTTKIKLLFSTNFRKKIDPEVPEGYYGNGFVLTCAEGTVNELLQDNLHGGVNMVREAKLKVTGEFVRSLVDHLEDKSQRVDLYRTFVISSWSRLGLEDLDFGDGKPLQVGSVDCNWYCLFIPVIGDPGAVTVLVSMPESAIEKFEHYMNEGMIQNGSTQVDYQKLLNYELLK